MKRKTNNPRSAYILAALERHCLNGDGRSYLGIGQAHEWRLGRPLSLNLIQIARTFFAVSLFPQICFFLAAINALENHLLIEQNRYFSQVCPLLNKISILHIGNKAP